MIQKSRTDMFDISQASDIMERGARRAIEESRRMGVPIPLDTHDGSDRFELPDGTVVQGDPWNGMRTAPAGWYERFNIPVENRPKVTPRPDDRLNPT